MAFTYVKPPVDRYWSRRPEVYITSDVHLGNDRSTNDLPRKSASSNYSRFLDFLVEVAAKEGLL